MSCYYTSNGASNTLMNNNNDTVAYDVHNAAVSIIWDDAGGVQCANIRDTESKYHPSV